MKCLCVQDFKCEIKIEADVAADPFWCTCCNLNLDLENFPISSSLLNSLEEWTMRYGEWIDWERDRLLPNALLLEQQHNIAGKLLTEKVKKELGEYYTFIFSPSTMASYFSNQLM
ncbi:hypothetical protein FQV28_06470 [Planomicrobium sp. CPCC 101079]|nr:hypothetical protein [Planomicrobium sp. CPCC 101079]TWT09389.1 hypothetical protein FQV28_06470 [Planomicrobium sp. CPCC 101079]